MRGREDGIKYDVHAVHVFIMCCDSHGAGRRWWKHRGGTVVCRKALHVY